MEITEKIYIEDRCTFKEAVKIINHLSPVANLQYKLSKVPQNNQVSVTITFEKTETLLLLIRLHEQLKMNYEINDIFITLEDILSCKQKKLTTGFRPKLRRLLVLLLIIATILLTVIITQVGNLK